MVTTRSRWTKPNYPYYFFDAKDLPSEYIQLASESQDLETYHLVVGARKPERAVTKHLDGNLSGLLQIVFDAADAWFEEDEEIFVYPKDPYKVRMNKLEVVIVEEITKVRPRLSTFTR